MKSVRLVFSLALLLAAGCSSPTEPRLPQPDPDDREPPPSTGLAEQEFPAGLAFITYA